MNSYRPCWFGSFLLAVALPAGVTAQDVVVPPGYDNREAPGGAFWALTPFDSRCQLLIGAPHLAALHGSLRAIELRRNGGDSTPTDPGKLAIKIWLSHTRTSPSGASRRFDDNRGDDRQQVFDGSVDLPRTSPPAKPPAPFSVRLAFSRPFTYLPGRTLCIETTTASPAPGTTPWWPLDAVVDTTAGGSARPYGAGCVPGAASDAAGAEPNSLTLGSTAALYASLPAGVANPVALLGSSSKRFGTYSLPIDLTPLGAPGCTLETSIDLMRPGRLTALSDDRILALDRLQIPLVGALAGSKVYAQWLVSTPRANSLGLALTNAVEITFGRTGSLSMLAWISADHADADLGVVVRGRMPVLRLSSSP